MESNTIVGALIVLLLTAAVAACPDLSTTQASPEANRLEPSDAMFPFCDRFSEAGYRNGAQVPDRAGSPGFTYGPGRHVIGEQLELEGGTVLNGAGPEHTTLYFPEGLMDLGIICSDRKDCWSWSNGMVRASGKEVGIQNLTIEFPPHRFKHYGREEGDQRGFNGIFFRKCEDCWVSDVRILNSDVGILVGRSTNITIDDTMVVANPNEAHIHYAISTHSRNILISNFTAENRSHHGLTAQWGAHGVYLNGILRGGIRLEPEHNGPVADTLYMNILGDIDSIQSRNRQGDPVHTSFVNVNGKSWGMSCNVREDFTAGQ